MIFKSIVVDMDKIEITSEELIQYKKTRTKRDINKTIYCMLMRLNNDYTLKKKDLDKSVEWSNVLYILESGEYINNWLFFNNYIIKKYHHKSNFIDLLLLFDMTLTKLYETNTMYSINKRLFETNKKIIEKIKLNQYNSFYNLLEHAIDKYHVNFKNVININYINREYKYLNNSNKLLFNEIFVDIGRNATEYYIMRLGKMNEFLNKILF